MFGELETVFFEVYPFGFTRMSSFDSGRRRPRSISPAIRPISIVASDGMKFSVW